MFMLKGFPVQFFGNFWALTMENVPFHSRICRFLFGGYELSKYLYSHRIHVWYIYYIYLILLVNVGKYTSRMDPMGLVASQRN